MNQECTLGETGVTYRLAPRGQGPGRRPPADPGSHKRRPIPYRCHGAFRTGRRAVRGCGWQRQAHAVGSRSDGTPAVVVSIDVDRARIRNVWAIGNPDKLGAVW